MSTPLSPSSRRSGFTLIEVAIALALFVIGALAIVRIFPPALGVIRNNESRATAVTLGESTLAKFKNKNSLAPEAVYDVDISGGWTSGVDNWQDYPSAVVNSASKSTTLPKQPTDPAYDASALGHFRYIYGEPHYIGTSQTILLNRPRASQTDTGVDIPVTAFYDDTVEGVQIGDDGYLDFSNAYLASDNTSFFDSANPKLPPAADRSEDGVTYYISYNWRECADIGCTNNPPIKGVLEEPISIPGLATSARILPCVTNSNFRVLPGGIRVRMRHNFVPTVATSGNSDYTTVSVSATSPRIYYTNYLSSDWRILVNDSAPMQDPSTPTTGVIRLPIPGLDDTFSPTGYLTRSDQQTAASPITPSNVDNKTGEIEYSISSWVAPRVRTIYRTLDNWAHQISVAPRSYVPYDAGRGIPDADGNIDFPREPWREYSWDASDGSYLYFHPGDAGKTVEISFTDGSGDKVNSICTIDEDLISKPASVPTGFIGAGNTSSQVARMNITDAVGDPVSASSILSVRGLSIRTRTAWLNHDRYNQVIVPGYRSLTQSSS
jgi:prepilin-type N-terminal cleavage/methylation domain-containing protein